LAECIGIPPGHCFELESIMLHELFIQALGLVSPWRVDDVDFQPTKGTIHFKTAKYLIAVIYLIAARLKHLPASPMRTKGAVSPSFA